MEKKYLKSFSIDAHDSDSDGTVNKILKRKGATAEDVISITFYHSGPYQTYTIWYRSARKKD